MVLHIEDSESHSTALLRKRFIESICHSIRKGMDCAIVNYGMTDSPAFTLRHKISTKN